MDDAEIREKVSSLVHAIRNDGWHNGFDTDDEPWIRQLMQLFNDQLKAAERRGEIAQLRMLKHQATLHGARLVYDFVEHTLVSLEQVPDQPLASENLKALAAQIKGGDDE